MEGFEQTFFSFSLLFFPDDAPRPVFLFSDERAFIPPTFLEGIFLLYGMDL